MDWLKTAIPALVCAALAGWLAWLASAPSIAITPDSVQYISAAQSLAHGSGVSTRVTEVAEDRGQALRDRPHPGQPADEARRHAIFLDRLVQPIGGVGIRVAIAEESPIMLGDAGALVRARASGGLRSAEKRVPCHHVPRES